MKAGDNIVCITNKVIGIDKNYILDLTIGKSYTIQSNGVEESLHIYDDIGSYFIIFPIDNQMFRLLSDIREETINSILNE